MIDSRFVLPILIAVSAVQTASAQNAPTAHSLTKQVDAYLDSRHEDETNTEATTQSLIKQLTTSNIADTARIEELLRAPRHSYPDVAALVGKTTGHDVACYHVDYESKFQLYVPNSYDPKQATPLVIVGHGGNSSMSDARAAATAKAYLRAYAPILAKELSAIVVAPDTTRGWGQIGNSLVLSTISQLQRQFHIDPDRIYATGQSMGGHMAYRAALTIGDRFGAVSPHSGGYDYVERGSIGNLRNVPGYATWGKREPYKLDVSNRTNAAWAKEHKLDWVFVEKDGGHEIYQDELPNVAKFFAAHPRNLYRKRVDARLGGAMKFVKPWGIKGWPKHTVYSEARPLRWNQQHWLELTPRPEHKGALQVRAENVGNNEFEIQSDQVRELFVHVHPRMIDFAKPVRITVNGKKLFDGMVKPDLQHMLNLAREFDDRGRIFWARIPVKVTTDRPF
ncbi:MAG: acetyl esterase/lipase [Planctomycetota bacterium]|jgi:acetyl esterase/lipase